jgi:lysophospholipase L1-like esterase
LILVSLVLVPLAVELGARAIYAIRTGNPGYLGYPYTAPVAADVIAVSIQAPISERRGTLEPGTHPLYVNGELLHTLEINSSGYRGRDIAAPKAAEVRIVALGGSSTMASECPEGETYPDQLEVVLDEHLGDEDAVEVLNMGMVGYSSADVAALFERVAARPPTDLVTVCSAFNDAFSSQLLDVRPGIGAWYTRALWGRSVFYTVMHNRLIARRHAAQPWETTLDRYRRALEDMAGFGRRRGIQVLFVLQPLADLDRMDLSVVAERLARRGDGGVEQIRRTVQESRARQEELCEIMVQVAEERGVPWVDPRAALVEASHPEQLFFAFLHLTPEGSRAMAEEVVRQLEDRYGGLEGVLDFR